MKKELRILVILIAVLLVGTVGYYFMPKKFGKNVNPSEVDRNYSAPRLGYINFWSKQRKYNFCFIIALLRKVDNFSM